MLIPAALAPDIGAASADCTCALQKILSFEERRPAGGDPAAGIIAPLPGIAGS
jgi:hypothetical protein